jgi:hypothetical protein
MFGAIDANATHLVSLESSSMRKGARTWFERMFGDMVQKGYRLLNHFLTEISINSKPINCIGASGVFFILVGKPLASEIY